MKRILFPSSASLLLLLAGCGGGAGAGQETTPAKSAAPVKAEAPASNASTAEPDDNLHCGDDAKRCATKGTLALVSSNAKKEGRAMLEKACALGSTLGCTNLGKGLYEGAGGPADQPRALTLWDKACDAGDGNACAALGEATVESNPVRARKALEHGCALDEKDSCANLALMAAKGDGGPRDDRTAAAMSEKACKKGAPLGCLVHGLTLRDGLGTQKDLAAAKAAFQLACDGGRKEGCDAARQVGDGRSADDGRKSTGAMSAGSMTVDGMTLKEISCDLAKGGPLGMLGVAGGVRARKAQLDACSKDETETRVVLHSQAGRFAAVEAKAKSATVGKCVERALVNQRSTFDGTCSVTIVHGSHK